MEVLSLDPNANSPPIGSLPVAPTDLPNVTAKVKELAERISDGMFDEASRAAKQLFSSGQVLSAEAYIRHEHSNPLLITETLIKALDSKSFAFEPDLCYMVARILRLFAELGLMRKLDKDESFPSDLQRELIDQLTSLISRSKDDALPGLKFELQCAREAIRRWDQIDFKRRYGADLLKFFISSAVGFLGVGGSTGSNQGTHTTLGAVSRIGGSASDGIGLINRLRKDRAEAWYDQVMVIGIEGARCAGNLEMFRRIQLEIKGAYDSKNSKTDKKLLLCAADVLADLVWRSQIPEIRNAALNGVKGTATDRSDAIPGLVQMASVTVDATRSIKHFKNSFLNLWRVRYHACCHLSALQNHSDDEVRERAIGALANRHTLENHKQAKALLEKLANDPPCEAYQSFFGGDTCKSYLADETAELDLQQANLQRRELEVELRLESLQERDYALSQRLKELQGKKDQLADLEKERAKVEASRRAVDSILARIQEEKTDLVKLRRALEQGQVAFLEEVEGKLHDLEKVRLEQTTTLEQLIGERTDREASEVERLHQARLSEAQAQSRYLQRLQGLMHTFQDSVQGMQEFTKDILTALPPAADPFAPPSSIQPGYCQRKDMQQKIEGHLLSNDHALPALTVCQGMGGVGKTSLARHVFHLNSVRNRFPVVRRWFHGSDEPAQLNTQFMLFARELGVADEKTTTKEAIERVVGHLENRDEPYLLVFDNAGSPASLNPYLPSKGGAVLITTRDPTWPAPMEVDTLEMPLAIKLINQRLDREDPNAQALAEFFGYHPLGLAHACAFITVNEQSIPDFLDLFSRQGRSILEEKLALKGTKLPTSVAQLWEKAFETLERDCPEALILLDQLAYVAANNIPGELLDRIGTLSAKEALIRQALIQPDGEERYTIHSLLQLACRVRHASCKELEQCMRALQEAYAHNSSKSQERETNRTLLPHAQELAAHGRALVSNDNAQTSQFGVRELLGQTLRIMGYVHRAEGKFWLAKEAFQEAYDTDCQVEGIGEARLGSDLDHLSRIYSCLGKYEQAERDGREALEIGERVLGGDHPTVAERAHQLGHIYSALGRSVEAEKHYRQSLRIVSGNGEKDHPEVPVYLEHLMRLADHLGRRKEAEEYARRALTNLRGSSLEQRHPAVLASVLQWMGMVNEAEEHLRQALRIVEGSREEDYQRVMECYSWLGDVLEKAKRYPEAEEAYKQALRIAEEHYGEYHPCAALYHGSIGNVLYDLKRHAEAEEHFRQALGIARESLAQNHLFVAKTLRDLAATLIRLDRRGEGVEHLWEAIAIGEKTLGRGHPWVKRLRIRTRYTVYENTMVQTRVCSII